MPDTTTNGVIRSEPAEYKLGGDLYYQFGFLPATFMTEGGFRNSGGGAFHIGDTATQTISLNAEGGYSSTTGNKTPSNDADGTHFDHSHWLLRFGMSSYTRTERSVNNGNLNLSTAGVTTHLLGVGGSTISEPNSVIDGETLTYKDDSATTFDVATRSSIWRIEWRPENRFRLSIGSDFEIGVQYSGQSKFRRTNFVVMPLTFSGGYADTSTRGKDIRTSLGAPSIVYGAFIFAHGTLQSQLMYAVLNDQMNALADYGLTGSGGGDSGSQFNVPFFQAAPSFFAGQSETLNITYNTNDAVVVGSGILHFGRGIASILAGGQSGQVAGTGDLLNVVDIGISALAGYQSPQSRIFLTDEQIEHRQMLNAGIGYALRAGLLIAGALAHNETLMSTGAGANAAASPDKIGSGMVEETKKTIGPDFVSGRGDGGTRMSINIHHDWHDFPSRYIQLFSAGTLSTPSLRLDNISNSISSQKNAYTDAALATDVDGAIGLSVKPLDGIDIFAGLDSKAVFGGGEDMRAGLGLRFGVFVDPVTLAMKGKNSVGVPIGVMAMCHKMFPNGSQCELIPSVGAGGRF